jgi:DNA-binding NtrC family response regulator
MLNPFECTLFKHHQGHITRTAADLGLERSHLYKKMRALGIRRAGDDDAEGESS